MLRPRALGTVAAVVGGALLLGLGEALQGVARARAFDLPFDRWAGFAEPIGKWLILAALTPIAFVAARRFRLERGRLARSVAAHVGAGLLFAGLAVVAVAAFLAVSRPELGFGLMASKVGTAFLVYYLAIYGALVGAVHAAHYRREARRRADQLVRQRLEVLRGQLNPHFLFNTLNAISTIALEGDRERVVESLGRVADLLRAALDEGLPQEVPLERELVLADKYLAIQETRFGDRLAVERDVDPAVLDALVPSMLLQPLLENAVTHGVATVPGDGWVRIVARADGDRLRLAVVDSGPGFRGEAGDGIGLANTRERLATLYGAAQRFTVGDAAEGGARVEVTILLRREAGG